MIRGGCCAPPQAAHFRRPPCAGLVVCGDTHSLGPAGTSSDAPPLLTLAGPELRTELEHALAEGYSLHSEPYDWGLNAQDEDVPSGPGSR